MKKSTTAVSVLAAFSQLVLAQQYQAQKQIPYNCYRESREIFGSDEGVKVTDILDMTGLNAYSHQLAAISTCTDNQIGLITGIVTVWGIWDEGDAIWTNQLRLNSIGRMSGLYEFDDQQALVDAGRGPIKDGQDQALQMYWFQEASPDQEQWYLIRKTKGDMKQVDWLNARRAIFNNADIDKDSFLSVDEARNFLKAVRTLDKINMPFSAPDYELENIDTHWFAASLMSEPTDNMSFEDYLTLEQIMEAWYSAGKLQATGFNREFNKVNKDPDAATASTVADADDIKRGEGLRNVCTTLDLDGDDRITMMQVQAGREGVHYIDVQTSKKPHTTLGVKCDDCKTSFESTFWAQFIEGTDFAGLWGTQKADGNLGGLGYIQRDSVCAQAFLTAVGKDSYDWQTSRPESFEIPSNYPEEYQERIRELNVGPPKVAVEKFPAHEHEEDVETGLVIATIIIWAVAFLLISWMTYHRCKQIKEEENMA